MNNTALIMIDMQRGFIDPSSPLCINGAARQSPSCTAQTQKNKLICPKLSVISTESFLNKNPVIHKIDMLLI